MSRLAFENLPDISLLFLPGRPGCHAGIYVNITQILGNQELQAGSRNHRPDADLETVRNVTPVETQALHVPEMAELVVRSRGRAARRYRLHCKPAHYQAVSQHSRSLDIAIGDSCRVRESLAKILLDKPEGEIVNSLASDRIGDDPVSPGRHLRQQVGITGGRHSRRGLGGYGRVENHAQRCRTVECLLVPLVCDGSAVGCITIHRRGGSDNDIAPAEMV